MVTLIVFFLFSDVFVSQQFLSSNGSPISVRRDVTLIRSSSASTLRRHMNTDYRRRRLSTDNRRSRSKPWSRCRRTRPVICRSNSDRPVFKVWTLRKRFFFRDSWKSSPFSSDTTTASSQTSVPNRKTPCGRST